MVGEIKKAPGPLGCGGRSTFVSVLDGRRTRTNKANEDDNAADDTLRRAARSDQQGKDVGANGH